MAVNQLHHPPVYAQNAVDWAVDSEEEWYQTERALPSTCSMCGAAVEDEEQHTMWHAMLMPLLAR